MKKILLFMGWLVCTSMYSQSQLMVFQDWSTTAGTQNFFQKSATKTDASGNVYIAGATLNGSGNYDMLLAKYNSSGVQQWIAQYNGTANYHDVATGLFIDGSGNVYITGTVINDTATNTSDIITIKYNSSGTQQWAATYNGSGNSYDSGADIIVDASGNVYITGGTYNTVPNTDAVTIKYNSSGTQQWVVVYNSTSNLNDAGVRISLNGTTVTITAAVQVSSTNYRHRTFDYTTSTGALLGGSLSSSTSVTQGEATDIFRDALGNIYLTGGVTVTGQGYNISTVKFDSTMALVWQRSYNGGSNLDDFGNALQVDASGNVYVTGYTTDTTGGLNFATIKYNSSGIQQWVSIYNDSLNGKDEARGITLDNSGNIYVTGGAQTDAINGLNFYTIKYNSSGTSVWAIDADGDEHLDDKATDIVIDNAGNILITGQSKQLNNTYEYKTIKYVEKNIIIPTDYNSETPSKSFAYYENKGQLLNTNDTLVPDVRYYTNFTTPAYFIGNRNFSFVFAHTDTAAAAADTIHRIDLDFTGGYVNRSAKVYPLEKQEDYISYFLAHIAKGVTEIHGNSKLVAPDLFPNIDVEYSSNQNGLKYYFIIKPGGNPSHINMEFTGASSCNLNGTSNELTINSSIGSISFDRPTVYQLNSSNVIIPITGWTADWQTNGASNKYKFNIGTFDSTKVLIIEIDAGNTARTSSAAYRNLTWSTYYGGNGTDKFSDIIADNNGDIYTSVETRSTNFPTTTGISNPNAYGLIGAVKFNRFGVRKYAFYYGVNNDSQVPIIHAKLDVNSTNNLFLTGAIIRSVGATTNIPFPLTPPSGAYVDNTAGAGSDVFLAKFNTTGTSILWATYYGGNNYEEYPDVNIDDNDNIYLTFWGSSDSLKKKVGAYWDSLNHGSVIVKFDNTLHRIWATSFTGGIIRGAFDKYDDFYITGNISSTTTNFPFKDPGSPAYIDSTFNGDNDIFIAEFGGATGNLKWGTAYGGSLDDVVYSIAIDKSINSNIYLTGYTKSTNFPFKYAGSGTYIDSVIGGTEDAFLLKFGSKLSLDWSSYFGGVNDAEKGEDVTTDPITNNVFFTGYTGDNAITFFGSSSYYTQSFGGGTNKVDAYLLCFTSSVVRVWGSYIGYTGHDDGTALIANNWNQLFLAGYTQSSQTGNFLNMNPGGGAWFVNSVNSGYDCHISRFTIDPLNPIGISELDVIDESLTIYPNPSSGEFNYQFTSTDKAVFIKVYNIIGELIYMEKSIINNGIAVGSVNLSSFSNGIYFVTAETAGHRIAKKIIKQ